MKKQLLLSFICACALAPSHAYHVKTWLNKGIDFVAQSNHKPKNAVAEKHSQYEGKVVTVHDGDTIRVLDDNGLQHKIRLAYIDAPEIQQAYGMASRDLLRALISNKHVQVNVADVDQYQREVGQIHFNGQDVNESIIAQGAAWHYASMAKRKQDKAEFVAYQAAQASAQQARLGLWKARSPEAPWSFRRKQRQAKSMPKQESGWLDWFMPSEK